MINNIKICKNCKSFQYGDDDGKLYEHLIRLSIGFCDKKKIEVHENTIVVDNCYNGELNENKN